MAQLERADRVSPARNSTRPAQKTKIVARSIVKGVSVSRIRLLVLPTEVLVGRKEPVVRASVRTVSAKRSASNARLWAIHVTSRKTAVRAIAKQGSAAPGAATAGNKPTRAERVRSVVLGCARCFPARSLARVLPCPPARPIALGGLRALYAVPAMSVVVVFARPMAIPESLFASRHKGVDKQEKSARSTASVAEEMWAQPFRARAM